MSARTQLPRNASGCHGTASAIANRPVGVGVLGLPMTAADVLTARPLKSSVTVRLDSETTIRHRVARSFT